MRQPDVVAGNADCVGEGSHAPTTSVDTSVAALVSDLFVDHREKIYRYCYSRLGTREAAEDATSQTFVNALASLPRLRGAHHIHWLFTIAHNVTVDYLRTPRQDQLSSGAVAPEDPDPSPETVAILKEGRLAVREMLNTLPREQRMAVQLYVSGFSISETAELLRKSEGAVKMLRRRGLSKLREMVNRRQANSVANVRESTSARRSE